MTTAALGFIVACVTAQPESPKATPRIVWHREIAESGILTLEAEGPVGRDVADAFVPRSTWRFRGSCTSTDELDHACLDGALRRGVYAAALASLGQPRANWRPYAELAYLDSCSTTEDDSACTSGIASDDSAVLYSEMVTYYPVPHEMRSVIRFSGVEVIGTAGWPGTADPPTRLDELGRAVSLLCAIRKLKPDVSDPAAQALEWGFLDALFLLSQFGMQPACHASEFESAEGRSRCAAVAVDVSAEFRGWHCLDGRGEQ